MKELRSILGLLIFVMIPMTANLAGNKPTWGLWIFGLLSILSIEIVLGLRKIIEELEKKNK